MTMMSTTNTKLNVWVDEVAQLTQPESIHWCTGSEEEWNQITQELIEKGTMIRLKAKRNSFFGLL